ncbi:MAG: delta-lactam-biosynthetic de-N-acetylase [Syntrophomonadaceae bacterium]|nr:delta-lactam-biosynthetic de-N-acetylase [Syntrophomonadaceae bacterium]
MVFVFLLSGCGQDQTQNHQTNPDQQPSQLVEEKNDEKPTPEPILEPEEELPTAALPTTELPETNRTPEKTEPATESLSWYLRPNLNHTIPEGPVNALDLLNQYQAFYVKPDAGNKIYLTFDEGYELGYTPQILDILKANDVKATFFITGHYLKSQPELVKRMVNEGHMVANHTWNHPNLAKVTPEKLQEEILKLEEEFKNLTGTEMPRYIRPPEGAYSETSLKLTSELGYKTVFWSLAFHDWDPNNQPGRDYSYQYVMDHIHPGAVILLHAVSQSNTEALNDIIVDLQKEGYEFALFN